MNIQTEILKLVEKKVSRAEIARQLNVSKAAISWHCKKLGLKAVSSACWRLEELELLRDKYESTDTEKLEKIFPSRSVSSIRRKASELGLKKNVLVRKTTSNSKMEILLNCSLKSHHFMGYILADGWISKSKRSMSLGFSASEVDVIFLKKLCRYIKTTNIYRSETDNSHLNCNKEVSIRYQTVCSDLEVVPQIAVLYDIKQKKTYNPPCTLTYDKFSNKEVVSILIGFIDGDGNLEFNKERRSYRVSIECHKVWMPFLEYIISRALDYLKLDCNVKVYSRKNRNTAVCRVNSKEFVLLLKDFAQKNNLPIMSRKWDKLGEV